MGASIAAMAGFQLAQGLGQANAMIAQGEYQKAMSDINARNAQIMSDRRLKKGDEDAKMYGQKVHQAIGSQRASYASQGVALDSEVAQQAQQQTYDIGFEDIQQIKTNAFLEAMGYKTQAEDHARQGRMAYSAAKQSAFNTILGSAVSAGRSLSDIKFGEG